MAKRERKGARDICDLSIDTNHDRSQRAAQNNVSHAERHVSGIISFLHS